MAKKAKIRKAKRKNVVPVTPAMLAEYAPMFGGKIPASALKAVGREYAKVSNPGPGALKRCVQSVAAGRKTKKNPPKQQRRRGNPIEQAADTYEKFHGREADEVFEVTETLHEHSVLSGIGKLISLKICAIGGSMEVTLKGFGKALLAQDENATQLFVIGGDQSVNVRDFGISGRIHELEVLGAATEVAYETRKDHLGESGGVGERLIHVHDFGSLRQVTDERRKTGSRLPIVLYQTRNKKLIFAGGGYDLPEVGIRG